MPNVSSTLNEWNTSQVIDMYEMFGGNTSFNQDIGGWDTGNVTTTRPTCLAVHQPFQPRHWRVECVKRNLTCVTCLEQQLHLTGKTLATGIPGKVTSFSYMFNRASQFNQPLDSWDTSSVTAMDHMFRMASAFNQALNNWDLSNVTTIRSMFIGAYNFNGQIGNWNTGNVTDMTAVFYEGL